MSIKYNFVGKRVLVTGAGKGIGRNVAIDLAKAGAVVIALSRTQEDLDSLKQEYPTIQTVSCDVSDWKTTRKLVTSVMPIHLLVNNAAILLENHFMDVSEESLTTSFSTNVFSIVNISQIVAKGMIERGDGGAIVNLSSILSKLAGLPHCVEYSSTKGAVSMLTKCMARELSPHKIRVNAVLPTILLTNMTKVHFEEKEFIEPFLTRHPLGEYPKTQDISDVILFLLSERSGSMTGADVPVDSGLLAV